MSLYPSLRLGSLLVTQAGISVAEAQALEEWHCGVCLGTHKATKSKPAMLAAADGESTAGGKGATFGKKICPACSHPNPVRKAACDNCGEPFMSGKSTTAQLLRPRQRLRSELRVGGQVSRGVRRRGRQRR